METKNQLLVVGIDPSLTNTAIVCGCDKTRCDITTMTSKPHGAKVEDRICRYVAIAKSVREWVKGLSEQFAAVAIYIEGYSMGSKGNAFTAICENGAILRYALLGISNRIIEVPPSTLKKFACGKGNAPKDMVAANLTKRYDVLFNSNDEYDAYGLWRMGLIAEGLDTPQTKLQQEAIDKLL